MYPGYYNNEGHVNIKPQNGMYGGGPIEFSLMESGDQKAICLDSSSASALLYFQGVVVYEIPAHSPGLTFIPRGG